METLGGSTTYSSLSCGKDDLLFGGAGGLGAAWMDALHRAGSLCEHAASISGYRSVLVMRLGLDNVLSVLRLVLFNVLLVLRLVLFSTGA